MTMSKLGDFGRQVVAVLLGVILAIVILTVLSSAPGHDEMYERLQRIEQQVAQLTCTLEGTVDCVEQ